MLGRKFLSAIIAVAGMLFFTVSANAAVTFTVYSGNDNNNAAFLDFLDDNGLSFWGKYDFDDAKYTGQKFTYTLNNNTDKSGTWNSGGQKVSGVAIKGGDNFLFVDYSSLGGVTSDNWCTDGSCATTHPALSVLPQIFNGGGKNPGISHLSLYITSTIPEPATWMMMILGFSFVGIATRRRKKISLA